jgi:hypothetical protein
MWRSRAIFFSLCSLLELNYVKKRKTAILNAEFLLDNVVCQLIYFKCRISIGYRSLSAHIFSRQCGRQSCIPVVLMCVVLAIFFQAVFELVIKEQHKAVLGTFYKLQEAIIILKTVTMTSPKVADNQAAVEHTDNALVSAQLSNTGSVYRYPAMLGELGLGSRFAAIYKLSKQSYCSRPCTCRKQYLF